MYGVNPVTHFWVVLDQIDGGKWQAPALPDALKTRGHKDGNVTSCMFAGDFKQFCRPQAHKPQTSSTTCIESDKYFPEAVMGGLFTRDSNKHAVTHCLTCGQKRLMSQEVFLFRGTKLQVDLIEGKSVWTQ